MTNKTMQMSVEINGEKTILELAKLMYGDKLEIRNKSLEKRLAIMPCKTFQHIRTENLNYHSFFGTKPQIVEGCEFEFHVYTRLIKKTGKYTLLSSH